MQHERAPRSGIQSGTTNTSQKRTSPATSLGVFAFPLSANNNDLSPAAAAAAALMLAAHPSHSLSYLPPPPPVLLRPSICSGSVTSWQPSAFHITTPIPPAHHAPQRTQTCVEPEEEVTSSGVVACEQMDIGKFKINN